MFIFISSFWWGFLIAGVVGDGMVWYVYCVDCVADVFCSSQQFTYAAMPVLSSLRNYR